MRPPSANEPPRLALEHATDAIRALTAAHQPGPVLLGITGPVGSGKSTLAQRIAQAGPGVIVRTDDYLPDYHALPERERDLPERSDLALLAEHLGALLAGRPIEAPVWCFQEHRRIGARRIEPAALIVCEGIHALHERVAELHHVRVYVEASAGVRRARWERIEREQERGWGVEAARAYFDNVAEPTFHARAEAYRRSAHLIIENDP